MANDSDGNKKLEKSIKYFKSSIRRWEPTECDCKLCEDNNDFWMLIRKPKLCSKYIRVSGAIKSSSRVALIKSMPSKYIKILMQKLFKTEVGISINFVKNCGTKDRPKRRHKNSNRFPFYWNLTDFWEFFADGAANIGLLSLCCTLTLLAVVFLSTRRDPPVSKWTYGIYLFDFLKMMTWPFPPSFLTTENRVLELELPDPPTLFPAMTLLIQCLK